jgi:hypothetical protein
MPCARCLGAEIGVARTAGMTAIQLTPVSRADSADIIMLPTDLSAETGIHRSLRLSRRRQRPAFPAHANRNSRLVQEARRGDHCFRQPGFRGKSNDSGAWIAP